MNPVLFTLGGINFSSYYCMGLVGLVFGVWLTLYEVKRRGLDLKLAARGALWTCIMGYLGARAMHIVFDGFLDIYIQKPLAIFAFWKGGLAFYGIIIFGLPTSVWWFQSHKASILKYIDCYILGVAFGVGIGRIGCYLNGCCFGEISSGQFANRFINYGLSAKHQFARDILLNLKDSPFPVFPAQLISFAANMVIFLIIWFFFRKRLKKDGTLFGTWLIMYGIFRFIIEFFREDDRGLFFNNLLSTSQLIAIVSFIIGVLMFVLPAYEPQKPEAASHD